MINNRNKMIVLLVSLLLVVGSVVLILNKDEKIRKVESDSKKYSKVNVSDGYSNPSKECHLWFDKIENQFVSYKDIVSKDRNLFIINHCAWDPYDIIENKDNKFSENQIKNVCEMQKELIQKNYISSYTYVNQYNNKCSNYTEALEVSHGGETCSIWKDRIENDYVTYYSFYKDIYLKEMKCSEKIDIPSTPYKTGDSCETLKLVNSNGELYTGILEKNGTVYGAKNDCTYPLYYINGYSTTISDYLEKIGNDNEKTQACTVLRDYASDANDQKAIDEYNKYCVDGGVNGHTEKITKKDLYTVTFNQNHGYGLECEGYATSSGVCKYTFSDDTFDVGSNLDTSNLKYYDSSFKGWSSSSDCSTIDYSGNFQLTKNMNGKTFYACYDGVNFNNKIHTTCDDAGDSESTLTSKIETSYIYSKEHSDNLSKNVESQQMNGKLVNSDYGNDITTDKTYSINSYVKIACTENFQYTYPSIFETVKSGTYFELIYNPQIHSTYTCQQTFDYASWENDYKEAIREELLVQLDKSNYNSKDNRNEVKVGTCGDENRYELREATVNYYNSYSFDEKNKNIINLIPSKGKYTLQYCSNKQVNVQDLYLDYVKSLVDNSKTLSEIFNDNGIDDYVNKHVGNREILKTINDNYKNTLSKSSISSDNYYKLSPTIKFEYENNNKVTKKIDLVFKNNDQYEKDNFKYANVDYDNVSNMSFNNVTYSWNIDGMNYGDRSAVNKYDYPITRTKEIRLTYEQEQNNDNYFYADYQTGKITSKKDTKSTKNKIDLGYVYPVDLNSSGQRNISFKLNTNSGISTPVKQILEKNNNNTYKCNFKITNDAVIKNNDTSSKLDGEKYKVKFYVRPIATSDIDPNNRLDSGLLGANWASRKGQLLMRIIEEKSNGNNTYNPDNLEYSFTLSAQNIDKIREYNELNKYDDFRLECNNMGGECNSDFLDNFEKGYYGSVVNTVNKDGRNRRKYYINGKWYRTDSLLPKNDFTEVYSGTKYRKESVYGVCDSSCKEDVNKCYECLYRKVNKGVLP